MYGERKQESTGEYVLSTCADFSECLDDGAFFALLLAPLIASAMLHATLTQLTTSPDSAVMPGWAIEPPLVLSSTPIRRIPGIAQQLIPSDAIKALSALATSRRNLVQLFTLCSFVLLVQLSWSLRLELKLAKAASDVQLASADKDTADPLRAPAWRTYWLRKGQLRRNASVVVMAFVVTGGCILVKIATAYIGHGVWSDMSPSDIILATLFYQFSLYVCIRLARRGFTLGELALVCSAATALFMEVVNLTRMKVGRDGIPWLILDSYPAHAIHQDIQATNPFAHLSTRSDPRISPCRVPALAVALSFATPGPKARSQTSFPSRKAGTSQVARPWLLRWIGHSMRRPRRHLGKMVSLMEGSMCMGRLLSV